MILFQENKDPILANLAVNLTPLKIDHTVMPVKKWDHVKPSAVFISDISEIGKKALRFNKTKTPIFFINCEAPRDLLEHNENIFEHKIDPKNYINHLFFPEIEENPLYHCDILIVNSTGTPAIISQVGELVKNYHVWVTGKGPTIPNFVGYFNNNDILELAVSADMCYTEDENLIQALHYYGKKVILDLDSLEIEDAIKYKTYKEFLIEDCSILSLTQNSI